MQVDIGYASIEYKEKNGLNVLLNFKDYKFTNQFLHLLDGLCESLSTERMMMNHENLVLIASKFRNSFVVMESGGFITRISKTAPTISVDATTHNHNAERQEKYDRVKNMWYRRLKEEFEIDNSDDIHYIFNKLNNQYSKYKGDIDSVRVCYSDGKGKLDKLYRYIKHHQRKDGYFDQVFYNVVTGNYIAVGFGFSEK